MGTCRLQQVCELNFPTEEEVLLEYLVDGCLHVVIGVDAQLKHTEEEHNEAQLMASAVVQPFIVAKTLLPVDFELWDCSGKLWEVVKCLDLCS